MGIRFIFASVVLALVALTLHGQPALIPIDPSLRVGTLPNGMQYYLQPNSMPHNRLWLMLLVRAGSIDEDDDQRGLAHFVEHMGFNGTAHFPKQQLIETLESFGMRFGADINAYTGYEETVYMLQVPCDRAGALDTALLILRDWAEGVLFDSLEFERERGVVIEEWRLGKGGDDRIWKKIAPIVYRGTKYAERDPIGDTAILSRAPLQAALRFYRQWYRPNLMSIIAVGDTPMDDLERRIKTVFGSLQNPIPSRQQQRENLPIYREPIIAVASDPEAFLTRVELSYRLPLAPSRTLTDWRKQLIEELIVEIINQELQERLRQPDAPCRLVSASVTPWNGNRRKFSSLALLIGEGKTEAALAMLATELERVRRYRFTSAQLDQARRELLRRAESDYDNRNKTETSKLIFQLLSQVQYGIIPTSPEFRYRTATEMLPTITLDELEQIKKQLLPDSGLIVEVASDQNPQSLPPSQDRVRAILDSIATAALPPYTEIAPPAALLDTVPVAGRIVNQRYRTRSGITEWDLSNGIRVVLKPTTNSDDEVHLQLFRPGGYSLASDDDLPSARLAAAIAAECGAGRHTALDIERYLKGRIVNLRPNIIEFQERFTGTASSKDLRTMFELLYLYATAPRFDSAGFCSYVSKAKALYGSFTRTPQDRYNDTLNWALVGYHPHREPLSVSTVERASLDRAAAFYRQRFSDLGGATVVIVGRFVPDSIRPLVERYIASLPTTTHQHRWRDQGIRFIRDTVRRIVYAGVDPKSFVDLGLLGTCPQYSLREQITAKLLEHNLWRKVMDVVREEKGASYSPGAYISIFRQPELQPVVWFFASCAPDSADDIVQTMWRIVDTLIYRGPDTSRLENGREILIREHEQKLQNDQELLTMLASAYWYGDDPDELLVDYPNLARSITAGEVQELARRYLSRTRWLEGIMLPLPTTSAPASSR